MSRRVENYELVRWTAGAENSSHHSAIAVRHRCNGVVKAPLDTFELRRWALFGVIDLDFRRRALGELSKTRPRCVTIDLLSGSSSAVERQLPKLDATGAIP